MPQIDCVVFDIGNVLVRWDPRNLYRRMGYSDADTATILAETRLLEINHRQLDAGAPFQPIIAALANNFPVRAAFIEAFHTRWEEMLGGAIDANVEVLLALRRAGMPVHAISNFSREKFDLARARFPFLDEFDELVLSGDIGMVKPDPDIFVHLVGQRQLNVSSTVFIDDNADNILTARDLGFATIHFSELGTDLAHELIALGLRREALK